MKKMLLGILFSICLLVPTSCSAGNVFHDLQDKVGADRAAHFAVCYLINDQLARHTKMSALERFLTVAAIGAAKEVFIDKQWDNGDFAADCLGALVYEIKF
jgi:hypothetical protein